MNSISDLEYTTKFMATFTSYVRDFFESSMESNLDCDEDTDLDEFMEDSRYDFEPEDIADEISDITDVFAGRWAAGAEKMVFIPKDKDFVIKILWDNSLDNCSEVDVYREAEERGLEDYFLKSWDLEDWYIGDNFKVTYYLQEKAIPSELDKIKKYSCKGGEITKSSKFFRKTFSKWHLGSSGSFCGAISMVGLSDTDKLFRFLCNHDINDLHSDNWTILNGKLKLLDYSGYC